MQNNQQPAGMIVFASKQILPNVLGLLHYDYAVKVLCIYRSRNEVQSGQPAERLKQWCNEKRPDITVEMNPFGNGQDDSILSQNVTRQIEQWQKAHPELRWIINATGGLKMMSFGLGDFVPDGAGGVEVIYREINREWFRFERTGGKIHSIPIALKTSGNQLDLLSVIELHHGQKWRSERATKHGLLDVLEIAKNNQWRWKETYEEIESANEAEKQTIKNSGDGFERLVADVLLELGIIDVHRNVMLRINATQVEENDVLCWHKEKVFLFDCKLTNQENLKEHGEADVAMITEMHDAASRARNLAGLGATAILVRPTRIYSDAHQDVAQALGIKIIDRRHNSTFVEAIAAALGIDGNRYSDEVKGANKWLLDTYKNDLIVVAAEEWEQRAVQDVQANSQNGCLNISPLLEKSFPDKDKHPVEITCFINAGGYVEFCIKTKVGTMQSVLTNALSKAIKKYSGREDISVEAWDRSLSKRTFIYNINGGLSAEQLSQLSEAVRNGNVARDVYKEIKPKINTESSGKQFKKRSKSKMVKDLF